MRTRSVVVMALLMCLAGAGCAEPAPALQAPDLIEAEPGVLVAPGHGILRGQVLDDARRGLPAAQVSLLRTDFFASADVQGRFEFVNVTAGAHQLLVNVVGFQENLHAAEVPDGGVANVTVQMLPDEARGSGYRAHTHDFWGQRTTYRLLDTDLDLAQPPRGSPYPTAYWTAFNGVIRPLQNNSYWTVPLRQSPEEGPSIVLPGTKSMTISLDWSSATLDRLGVCYLAPGDTRKCADAKASGGQWEIPVATGMADSGHQAFSLWRIELYHPPVSGTLTPSVAAGSVHVVIDLAKGDLVLDPPHEDFWADGPERLVTEEEVRSASVCCSDHPSIAPDDLVPPGTTRLRIEHTWRFEGTGAGPLDYDYRILVRRGNMNPHETPVSGYDEPTPTAGSAAEYQYSYELEVLPEETDAFYQGRSNWEFVLWNPVFEKDNFQGHTRPVTHSLRVVAINPSA